MKIMKSYESNICEVNRSAVNQKLKGQKFKQRSEIHKLNNKILIANFCYLFLFIGNTEIFDSQRLKVFSSI